MTACLVGTETFKRGWMRPRRCGRNHEAARSTHTAQRSALSSCCFLGVAVRICMLASIEPRVSTRPDLNLIASSKAATICVLNTTSLRKSSECFC